jgi:deoxycytidylate deaminase
MIGSSKFNRLIEIARALAPRNRDDIRNHHVTFLIKKSKILSIGINDSKTNAKNLKYNYSNRQNEHIGHTVGSHSELQGCIKYGKDDCTDITFVNIRIDRNQKINNSYPCKGCQSLLEQVGFKKMFYTTSSGEFEEYNKK